MTNAGQVPPGSRVAVIGAGGVGLNVVQGAAIAGCERIIAIDLRPQAADDRAAVRRDRHIRRHAEAAPDVAADVRRSPPAAASISSSTRRQPATLTLAFACTRKGGAVGSPGSRMDAQATIPMFPFVMQEKRLLGSFTDRASPARHPESCRHREGRPSR